MRVGERVRAWSDSLESSSSCTLACDNEDGTFDLIQSNGEELPRVEGSRIKSLEEFELESGDEDLSPVDMTPVVCKERGNIMFTRCKDYDAAMSYYNKALSLLQKKSEYEKIGTSVLVRKEGSVEFPSGIISDASIVNDKWDSPLSKFEVLYDLDKDGEEDNVTGNRLVLLSHTPAEREVSRHIGGDMYTGIHIRGESTAHNTHTHPCTHTLPYTHTHPYTHTLIHTHTPIHTHTHIRPPTGAEKLLSQHGSVQHEEEGVRLVRKICFNSLCTHTRCGL